MVLRISCKDHDTNEEVRAKMQQAIGPHEDLLTIVKRRKLQWYGHFSPFIRSGQNHLAKHNERGKKTRQTTSGNGQAWSSASPKGQRRTGENGEKCEIICGAPTTFTVKGLMMMMVTVLCSLFYLPSTGVTVGGSGLCYASNLASQTSVVPFACVREGVE